MTVFRNATENERLAYGSQPYMQFRVFGGGANFKPLYLRND